jgi:hypothetical protein
VADALSHDPVSLIGLMSFGTSALLFMVAEELMLEAHKEGDHVWWVDPQLHVGFFASLMVGKCMPQEQVWRSGKRICTKDTLRSRQRTKPGAS